MLDQMLIIKIVRINPCTSYLRLRCAEYNLLFKIKRFVILGGIALLHLEISTVVQI